MQVAYIATEAVPFVEKLGLQQTGTLIASRDDNRFQVSTHVWWEGCAYTLSTAHSHGASRLSAILVCGRGLYSQLGRLEPAPDVRERWGFDLVCSIPFVSAGEYRKKLHHRLR